MKKYTAKDRVLDYIKNNPNKTATAIVIGVFESSFNGHPTISERYTFSYG